MSDITKKSNAGPKKNASRIKSAAAPTHEPLAQNKLKNGPSATNDATQPLIDVQSFSDGSLESQASLLGNPLVSTTQRQIIARQIGKIQGNSHLQRVIAAQPLLANPGLIQRSPLSDELEKLSANKTPQQIFTLLGQKKFKDGAQDTTELTALNTVLAKVLTNANDRWVAQRILGGKLGMSSGITAKGQPGLATDIPPQPIEVHFFPGASNERALVIAGVHGSERQGIEVARILIDDVLKKAQPHYSVIVVPSLFPAHAHKNWGVEGKRERGTFTNRNFPDLNQEVVDYQGGEALDAAGNPIKAKEDENKQVKSILPENVMLMELIDRFQPTRIISIHGTHSPSSAGVFADPHFLSPAKEKAIEVLSTLISSLWGIVAHIFGTEKKDDKTRLAEVKTFLTETVAKVDQARTQNDIDLALASAYAIASKTASAAELQKRFSSDPKKQTTPSVAGNEIYEGKGKENATWREDMDPKTKLPKPWQTRAKNKGISLGLYGPAKGISVFTVEPPVNRALDFYDGKNKEPKGDVVSKAQRETELKAYAEAVATILLGPDKGADALSKQRP